MVKGLVLFFLVVLVAVLNTNNRAEAAVSCSDVDPPIMSCGAYLMGQGEKPPAACCSGLEKVKGMVSTQDDRRQACSCIKAAATRLPKIDESKVSSLPNECGIQISFPVSTKIDCTTIP